MVGQKVARSIIQVNKGHQIVSRPVIDVGIRRNALILFSQLCFKSLSRFLLGAEEKEQAGVNNLIKWCSLCGAVLRCPIEQHVAASSGALVTALDYFLSA